MLEWLKTILGETYTDEIDKKVSEEVGKSFVARADFNSVKAELKAAKETVTERDGQLEALRKSDGDVKALRGQIEALQADNKKRDEDHAAELKRVKVDAAVEAALTGARAKNSKAVRALLDLDGAELLEDGTVKGLTEQIKALAEAEDSAFLFEAGTKTFKGMKPGESGDKAPPAGGKAPKDMSYDELCAYMAAHPDAPLE